MNARAGFSLIELMIVILIIGVLMAGVLGGMRYLQQAKLSTTETRLKALDTALEAYNTRIGTYPQDLEELVEGPKQPELARKWGGIPLIDQKELSDGWNQPFHYQVNAKGTRPPYELYSVGAQGEANPKPVYSPQSQ